MKALSLAVALVAGGGLVAAGPSVTVPPPAGLWPHAQRADFTGLTLTPLLFLDARTVVGTQPTKDGAWLRLLLRDASGQTREIHRLRTGGKPQFATATVAGSALLWTESTGSGQGQSIWTAPIAGGPARMVTADLGNAVFYGSQDDLVVAQERVWWAVAPTDGAARTEIRSAPLGGGPVTAREEPGEWALTTWPWLTDDPSNSGTTHLRDLLTGQEQPVAVTGGELATCDPVWCRVMITTGPSRVDLMHPDGSARRPIGDNSAQAASADPVLLDRFVPLSEPTQQTDLTGDAELLVYDVTTGRTVTLSPSAADFDSRNGVLWWSTGSGGEVEWHTLDLRTA